MISIKTLLNLNELSIEELVGRLRAAEGRLVPSDSGEVRDKSRRLIMAEDHWLTKWRHRLPGNAPGSRDKGGGQAHGKNSGGARTDGREVSVKLTSKGTPSRKGRCYNCEIYGHWGKEC